MKTILAVAAAAAIIASPAFAQGVSSISRSLRRKMATFLVIPRCKTTPAVHRCSISLDCSHARSLRRCSVRRSGYQFKQPGGHRRRRQRLQRKPLQLLSRRRKRARFVSPAFKFSMTKVSHREASIFRYGCKARLNYAEPLRFDPDITGRAMNSMRA